MSDELHPAVQVDIDRDKIKRAVKEALDDKAIEDLNKQNVALATQMSEGFAKINTRLDVANGKLMKHEYALGEQSKDIGALQRRDEKLESQQTFWQRNQDKIVWGVVIVILMLFYYLLTHNGFPPFLAH
jgi:hypothetical protein